VNINFETIIIVLIFVFILIGLVSTYFVKKGRQRAWTDLAERIGVNCEAGGFFNRPVVTGVYQRHQIKLDSYVHRAGKSSTTYTRIVVYLNRAANFTFSISQENVFNKIGKKLGAQEITIGDDELDQRYLIKGEPEAEVLRVLSSLGMRQRLLEAPAINIEIRCMEVYYHKQGFETDPNKLIALLDLMCAFADAAERL
jgi:hypothetical protein